jgi:dipeptide/tripeptide permease
MFWALFDQTGSAWVLQAQRMDRQFLGMTWLESQVQAVNPILILTLIPVFAYGIYPAAARVVKVTPLRKIGVGLFLTALAFGVSGWIETRIQAAAPQVAQQVWTALGEEGTADLQGLDKALKINNARAEQAQPDQANAAPIRPGRTDPAQPNRIPDDELQAMLGPMPNIGWQFLAYLLLTAAEVMVSITALEFAYTQAPKKMKSFIMGIYFLGVSLGNLFTAGVNYFIIVPEQHNAAGEVVREATTRLQFADYYWFFSVLMLVVAVAYVVWSRFYKGQTYIQGTKAMHAEALAEAPDAR